MFFASDLFLWVSNIIGPLILLLSLYAPIHQYICTARNVSLSLCLYVCRRRDGVYRYFGSPFNINHFHIQLRYFRENYYMQCSEPISTSTKSNLIIIYTNIQSPPKDSTQPTTTHYPCPALIYFVHRFRCAADFFFFYCPITSL